MKREDNEYERIICPYCGKLIPNTSYCILCGKLVQKQQAPKETNEAYSISSEIRIEENLEKSVCPLCRNEIPPDHNFCHLCGAKRKKIIKDDQPQRVICNRCRKPNPPNIDYCIHCGLKRQIKKSKLLEKPFKGYQMDLSEVFRSQTFPTTMLKHDLMISSLIFPSKTTVIHSNYFGVSKTQPKAVNSILRNLGGFDTRNLSNYMMVFILMISIYAFWYFGRYESFSVTEDNVTNIFFVLVFGGLIMNTLLMLPVWLATFFVYRNTGQRLNFRIESSRVFTTVVFNILWMLFGFGPIFLRLGEFKDFNERIIFNRSFMKGIALGSAIVVLCALIFGVLCTAVIGIPGEFVGTLFNDSPVRSHIIASYFGSVWIALIMLLPLGDYYDKVIKQWNQLGYIVLIIICFFLLFNSFSIIGYLAQFI